MSLDVDPDCVARLTIHSDSDIHLASSGQTAWKGHIDLIEANEFALRSGKEHVRGHPANSRGHARRASEADTRAEQDEEDLIAFRAKINGQGDEAVLLLIKLRDRFIGL